MFLKNNKKPAINQPVKFLIEGCQKQKDQLVVSQNVVSHKRVLKYLGIERLYIIFTNTAKCF